MQRKGTCADRGHGEGARSLRLAKTRLCPPLHPAQAAALSAAFLRDITENIAQVARTVPVQGYIAYAPAGAESWFDGHLAEGTGLLLADGSLPGPQDVQGFGRCLLHAAQAMLGSGYAATCLLNSDSPTLPTEFLAQAAAAVLTPGERVVLGPAEDGGYYLLGMQRPHARTCLPTSHGAPMRSPKRRVPGLPHWASKSSCCRRGMTWMMRPALLDYWQRPPMTRRARACRRIPRRQPAIGSRTADLPISLASPRNDRAASPSRGDTGGDWRRPHHPGRRGHGGAGMGSDG